MNDPFGRAPRATTGHRCLLRPSGAHSSPFRFSRQARHRPRVGDGLLDLVPHFRTSDTGLACGDTSASLAGTTFSGHHIEGADSGHHPGWVQPLRARVGAVGHRRRAVLRRHAGAGVGHRASDNFHYGPGERSPTRRSRVCCGRRACSALSSAGTSPSTIRNDRIRRWPIARPGRCPSRPRPRRGRESRRRNDDHGLWKCGKLAHDATFPHSHSHHPGARVRDDTHLSGPEHCLDNGVHLSPRLHGRSARFSGSPDIKVGRSPGRSDQELCDLGRNRLIHGFFWDLPEQYFLASVDGRLRRPRSGWGACSAAAKSRRKVFNLWLLLDDRWAGDTAQVEPVR